MGFVRNIVNGDSFDTAVIRREKTQNGYKNVKDKAAEIEDPDTGETLLKFKSDGLKVPKPENQQFETLWYRDWMDRIFRSKSHTDFLEVYLEDDSDGDYVEFDSEGNKLELSGSEGQFQTHRNLEAEKTLDIFSDASNEKWYFLAGLGTLIIIDIAGQYIVNQGMQRAVIEGVRQGYSTVQGAQQTAQSSTGLIPVFALMGRQKMASWRKKIGDFL